MAPSASKNTNSLLAVRNLIEDGKYAIKNPVRNRITQDFGWKEPDVLKALKKLKASQCYKSEEHWQYPGQGVYVDFYRAPRLHRGEDVFTHFHILNDKLIIVSFKRK